MNIGTIGHRGLSSPLTSVVFQRMISEIMISAVMMDKTVETPVNDTKQKQFGKRKLEPYWITAKIKMHFEELPLIEKEKIDIELLTAELKDGHDLMVEKVFNVLLNDDSVTHVNEFSSWTNQYLAQLIHAVAGWYMMYIDETLERIVKDERQRVNHNDLCTIHGAMRNIYLHKTLTLTTVSESMNTYPISREGVTHLKEFTKIITRFENLVKKVNEFSKNKLR